MNKKIRKIAEFESTRDYLRHIVKIICERLEIKDIDVYKLNSKEDCIKCIESIVKNYNSSQDNQALYKEIDALKEEIATLTNANFDLSRKNKELENYIDNSSGIDINNLFEEDKIEKINRYLNAIFFVTFIIFSLVLTYKII